jgi:hypothetical protein
MSRNKFICFVDDCNISYLYPCTLKKHLTKCHPAEMKNLYDQHNNTKFIEIYKKISKKCEEISKIKFKSLKDGNELISIL